MKSGVKRKVIPYTPTQLATAPGRSGMLGQTLAVAVVSEANEYRCGTCSALPSHVPTVWASAVRGRIPARGQPPIWGSQVPMVASGHGWGAYPEMGARSSVRRLRLSPAQIATLPGRYTRWVATPYHTAGAHAGLPVCTERFQMRLPCLWVMMGLARWQVPFWRALRQLRASSAART
jgi:hypothetical protein